MNAPRQVLALDVPVLPATRNQRDRMNRWARSSERDDWRLLIPQCPLHERQAADPRRHVTITFTKTRGPLSDPDNLVARGKVVLDALVFRHWLIDDSPRYITLEVVEGIGVELGTAIEISEGGR